MLVAIPLFGQDVAPRFGFAERFLIAEILFEKLVRENDIALATKGWVSRLGALKDLGVDTVICGGFNRLFLPLAQDLGIDVIAGVSGNARQVLEAFARGETVSNFCFGKHGWLGTRGGKGHNRGKGRRGGRGMGRGGGRGMGRDRDGRG
ncbi:MAG: hypothetical protein GY847_07825 [Proteobacteria bacterium]|nr:hypothetical protein [Pseudomonadota bacterium]